MYYIFTPDKKIKKASVEEWGEWFHIPENNRIARDEIMIDGTIIAVSTVFLGLDHGWALYDKKRILFETMIFDDAKKYDGYQTRCATYKKSLQMHQNAIDYVKNGGE